MNRCRRRRFRAPALAAGLPAAAAAAFGLFAAAPAAHGVVETFDTGVGRFTAAANNTGGTTAAGGNNFGFRNTNLTGGTSPAGEAGGQFARATNASLAFLADPTVSVARNQPFTFTGEFVIQSNDPDTSDAGTNNAFDGTIFLGFFNPSSGPSFAGFEIAEPGGSSGAAFRARLASAQGGLNSSTNFAPAAVGQPYTVSITFAPTGTDGSGTLTGSITPTSGAGAGVLANLGTLTVPAATGTFTRFGFGTGFVGSDNAAQTAEVYFDNLNYVPEPSAAAGLLAAGGMLLARRRRRSGRPQ